MADGVHIPVKLKEQGKLHALANPAVFHQDTLAIQFLLQNLRAEPLRDQCDFQITTVSVVGHGTEIYNTIRIERAGFALRIQADTHRSGNRLRCGIGKCGHAVCHSFCQLGSMDIFQVIFDFISHSLHTSIS